MRSDSIKNRLICFLQIQRSHISGHVNTPVFFVLAFERMITKRRMKRILAKCPQGRLEFLAQLRA